MASSSSPPKEEYFSILPKTDCPHIEVLLAQTSFKNPENTKTSTYSGAPHCLAMMEETLNFITVIHASCFNNNYYKLPIKNVLYQ